MKASTRTLMAAVALELLAGRPALAQDVAQDDAAADALAAAEDAEQAAADALLEARAAKAELDALKAQIEADKEAAKAEKAAEKQAEEQDGKKDGKKGKKKGGTFQGALDKKPGLDVEANLFALWSMKFEGDEPGHHFSVNVARIQLEWSQWKLIEAVVDLDVGHTIQEASVSALLRDVFVLVQPLPWLGLRVGQFKKPFSRLELVSRSKLDFVNRGASNGWMVEWLGFGDRDIGIQFEGRLCEKIELDYMLGVFNGTGANVKDMYFDGAKDLAFRLEAEPTAWLGVGAGVSLAFTEQRELSRYSGSADLDAGYADRVAEFDEANALLAPLGPDFQITWDEFTDGQFRRDHSWMKGVHWSVGADALFKLGDARIMVENMFADSSGWFRIGAYRYSWSLVLAFSYRIRLKKDLDVWLEPVARGEMLTLLPRPGQWSARLWQLVPGINLHLGKHVRIMIDGEFVITEGPEPDESTGDDLWPGEWPGDWKRPPKLLVQVAFDI